MLRERSGTGHDPLRSSGRLHEANRLQRGVAEFLRLPLVLTTAFCLVALGVSLLDRLTPDDSGFRALVREVLSEAAPESVVRSIHAVQLMPKPSDEPEAAHPRS